MDEPDSPFTVVGALSHTEAFARPHDVAVAHGYAVVAGKGGSLAVVDVRQPASPHLTWWRRDPQQLEDLQTVLPLDDGRWLVGGRRLFSLDLSQPSRPQVHEVRDEGRHVDQVNGMVRRGDVVLAACKSGVIALIDVADVHQPAVRDARLARSLGECHAPHDIDLDGQYAVVVDGASRSRLHDVVVYRVTDAAGAIEPCDRWEPVTKLREESWRGANRARATCGHAYVACYEEHTIGVLQLPSRDAPAAVVATLPSSGQPPCGMALHGRLLLIAGGRSVEALDVSEPGHPRSLGSLTSHVLFPAGGDSAHDLVYVSGYVLVTAQNDHRLGILKLTSEEARALAED